MNKRLILILLFTAIFLFAGCNQKYSSNNLIISEADEETILKYLDTETNDILSSTTGKMYSAFEILGTDRKKVYIWMIKAECQIIGYSNKMYNKVSIPVVLYVDVVQDGITIKEHKYPRDGIYYGKDIKKLFPQNVVYAMHNDNNERSTKLEEVIQDRLTEENNEQ